MKNFLLTVIILLFTFENWGIAQVKESALVPVITLEQTVYVTGLKGKVLKLLPGEYEMMSIDDALRLRDNQGNVFDIQGARGHHNETVAISIALVVSGEDKNQLWLVLLTPEGTSLEAMGTLDGVQTRGSPKKLHHRQRAVALNDFQKMAGGISAISKVTVTPPADSGKVQHAPLTATIDLPDPPTGVDSSLVLTPARLSDGQNAWVQLRGFNVDSRSNIAQAYEVHETPRTCHWQDDEVIGSRVPWVELQFLSSKQLTNRQMYLVTFFLSLNEPLTFTVTGAGINHKVRLTPGNREVAAPVVMPEAGTYLSFALGPDQRLSQPGSSLCYSLRAVQILKMQRE